MDYGITQDTRNVAHQAVSRFLGLRNVVACGLGYKVSRGEQSDELSLVVSVTHKVPAAQLATRDLIPRLSLDSGPMSSRPGASGRSLPQRSKRIRAYDVDRPSQALHRPPRYYRRDIRAPRSGRQTMSSSPATTTLLAVSSNAGEVGDPIYQPGSADRGTAVRSSPARRIQAVGLQQLAARV